MSGWDALEGELGAWAEAGRAATLWWRDDDAQRPGPALERLLGLAEDTGVPLALAVIPAGADAALARRLENSPRLTVLQHGYAHRNHAPAGERKCELGAHRPGEAVLAELGRGRARLRDLGFARALPVLVPPWNRMEPGLAPALAAAGFAGLSSWGPRRAPEAAPGLRQVNVHVNAVRHPGAAAEARGGDALDQAVAHLAARRAATADAGEPTGLMTHHLKHDRDGWAFVADFLRRTRDHPGARWLAADEAFGGPVG